MPPDPHAPKPPYAVPPAPPLSGGVKSSMINWIINYDIYADEHEGPKLGGGNPSDATIIRVYTEQLANYNTGKAGKGAPGVKDIPGVAQAIDLEHFLGLLTQRNFWIRVAEFLVGGTLLVVGFNGVLRQTMGGREAPQIRVPKNVKKAASAVVLKKPPKRPVKTARFKE